MSGNRPLAVTFIVQSTTTHSTISSWLWDFGDGISGSTQQNPTHVYIGAGSYVVQLTVGTGTYTDTKKQTNHINVVPLSPLVITYAYDADRLATQNGQSTFTWDADGNLLQDGSTVYAYDFANRLISTTLSGVNTQFGYNGDGVRLRLVEAGTLTTYTQDLVAPLPVVLQAKTGTASTQYVYSLGTRPLAEYEAAAWEHLLPDPLGSVRQIADSSGNVTLLKSYEPYGSVLNSQGSAASVFAYAGEQMDAYIVAHRRPPQATQHSLTRQRPRFDRHQSMILSRHS